MIDNRELIIPLLEFPHKDIFYFVQIIQRKKDHPEGTVVGSNNNSRLIKPYYIKSIEQLEKQWKEMVLLAEVFDARVSINLNARNFQKAAFHTLQKIANQMSNGDFQNIYQVYSSVCGEYHSEIDKRWIIDLDKDQLHLKDEICTFITRAQTVLKHHEKAGRYKIIAEIPSKTGLHILTNPFDLSDWNWKDVEIHKNNPTNLYIP